MTLRELRKMAQAEFGSDLEHMTPANVREFLDRVQPIVDQAYPPGQRIRLHEEQGTYEAIVRDFLRKTLELPPERAVTLLWLYCLEFVAASVNDLEEERFSRLFATLGDGEPRG